MENKSQFSKGPYTIESKIELKKKKELKNHISLINAVSDI